MKKLVAIGLACVLPTGISAEDPAESDALLGTMDVLVIEESAPLVKDAFCARVVGDKTECMAFNRAVLSAHMKRVSVLRERGRWM